MGGENVLHHVQRGELSGMGKCSGDMSRGKMFKEEMSGYTSLPFCDDFSNRTLQPLRVRLGPRYLQTRSNKSAKHNKPRPTPHCRVLPPGEFNGTI